MNHMFVKPLLRWIRSRKLIQGQPFWLKKRQRCTERKQKSAAPSKQNLQRWNNSSQRWKVFKNLWKKSSVLLVNINVRNRKTQINRYWILYRVNSCFSESIIEKKIEEFQKALYRHQTSSPEEKLYNPEAMKQFTNKNSPGLFQDLLNCITRSENLSKQRKELQEQRVVSLLLVIAYFR